jgi:hypothetical protein
MEDKNKFTLPMITSEMKDDHYELTIPVEFFEGCEVYDKETDEFLGWVDSKNKRIVKYEVREIIRKEDDKHG